MKVIADTSIWSLFLRRDSVDQAKKTELLKQVILEKRIQMLGIIRQELLSGIKNKSHFKRISEILSGFPDLLAQTEDHLLAAEYFNRCRSKGVQGSPVDFLICAQASRNKMKILASDKDFENYSKHIPIDLER